MKATHIKIWFAVLSIYTLLIVSTFLGVRALLNYHRLQSLKCYYNSLPTMIDALDKIPNRHNKNPVFFIDTECQLDSEETPLSIDRRTACAVESAARHNPNRKVYLLVISPGLEPSDGTQKDIFDALNSYDNLEILYLNVGKYLKETIMADFSYYAVENNFKTVDLMNILRLVTLWRYGGIFLELNVVTLKSFDELGDNFLAAATDQELSVEILGFSMKGKGHKHLVENMEEFLAIFEWSKEASRGGGAMTRYALSVCGFDDLRDVINKTCDDLTIYPPSYFFPVPSDDWSKYFEENPSQELLDRLDKSYTMCTWNQRSFNTSLPLNSTSAYIRVAKKSCPRVLDACNDYF